MSDDEELTFGVRTVSMRGSKTPGELAFVLGALKTVVCGDLIRGQRAGELNLLPDPKLTNRNEALLSVRRLAELGKPEAVLVGDGQSIFRGGTKRLHDLLERET